jgi:hypothetical protein
MLNIILEVVSAGFSEDAFEDSALVISVCLILKMWKILIIVMNLGYRA